MGNGISDQETGPGTVACPNCGKAILALALQCKYCRAWTSEISRLVAPEATDKPAVPSFEKAGYFSNGQSIRHLVWLSVLSFGLYEVYWFYRNWRALAEHTGMDLKAGWRTLGLLVPVVNVFMVYHQFRLVHVLATQGGRVPSYSPWAMALGYFLLVGVSNVPGPMWPLTFLTVLPMIPVQAEINAYWAGQQPDRQIREHLNRAEIALLFLGGFMLSVVIGSVLSGGGLAP